MGIHARAVERVAERRRDGPETAGPEFWEELRRELASEDLLLEEVEPAVGHTDTRERLERLQK